MQVKPLHDRVLVKLLGESETTKTGIIIPSTAEKKKEKGEVVAVGPGKRLDNGTVAPMSVKPGDKVMFKSYMADEIKDGDTEYLMISESDIMGILA
jgi:chaperonin GroES